MLGGARLTHSDAVVMQGVAGVDLDLDVDVDVDVFDFLLTLFSIFQRLTPLSLVSEAPMIRAQNT